MAIAAVGRRRRHYSVHVHADDAGAAVEAALDVRHAEPHPDHGTRCRRRRASAAGRLEPRAGGAGRRRRRRRRRDCSPARARRCCGPDESDVAGQRQAAAARAGQHRRRAGDGAAQRLCRRRGTGRRMYRRDRAGASTSCRVPTGSMVQGLAALAVHDADRLAVDDGYTMAAAAAGARTARCGWRPRRR